MAATQQFLDDAAISLDEVLSSANIQHGIFGGYAISALGGPRVSMNVDRVASSTRDQLVALIGSRSDFALIPTMREDYVSFL